MATRAGHGDASAGTGGETVTAAVARGGPFKGQRLLKVLVGSGAKIGLFISPFLLVGLLLNIVYPSAFDVGGPSAALRVVSIVVLIPGLTIWAWSVALILRKVPRGELITNGPYSIVKHPLYTGVALLVLPWIGFLFNTWLGAVIGIILYIGSRIFAPAEEAELPGNVNDLSAAREHVLAVIRSFAENMPTLADGGYEGAGHGILTPVKKPARIKELDINSRTRNALIRSRRCLGERGFALLTQRWQTLQHVTASPGKIGQIARAALVLVLFEHKMLT
jgi:protein-S-isoprenylcysteine O-methyltransferase Ste14